jgi:HlyD family secretion protein
VGDRVAPGQPVARLAQPQLEEQLRATRERLAELERQQALQQTQTGRALALSRGLLDQQRAALERQIAAAQQRARVTAERVATQEALLEQGLITRQALLNTQNELAAAQQEVENSRASLQQASLRSAEDDKRASAELAALGLQIGEARRQLAALQASRSEASQVLSSFAGRVVELKVGAGALVAPGAALVTIEPQAGPGTGTLEAVIYVPAADGKKVEPGMTVQLVPSTVKREEHGYMVGHVHSVSDYVATGEAIASLLQNRQLAQELAGGSSAIEVRAALEESPTASGYRWSSGSGPPYRVRPGTLAQAEVVVYRQPPVTLVIPLLKKWLGLD